MKSFVIDINWCEAKLLFLTWRSVSLLVTPLPVSLVACWAGKREQKEKVWQRYVRNNKKYIKPLQVCIAKINSPAADCTRWWREGGAFTIREGGEKLNKLSAWWKGMRLQGGVRTSKNSLHFNRPSLCFMGHLSPKQNGTNITGGAGINHWLGLDWELDISQIVQ